MRTLVTLGALAVATALLGRIVRAARQALPRVGDRAAGEHVRDLALRAAAGGAPRSRRDGRGAGGAPARRDVRSRMAGDPRREPGQGQRGPHPDRAAGGVHDRDEEPSGAGAGGAGARRHAEPGAGAEQGDRAGDWRGGGAADRVQPRVGGQADGAQEGRARGARADARALPDEASGEAVAARRSSGRTGWSCRRCSSTTRMRRVAGGRWHRSACSRQPAVRGRGGR